MKKRDDRGRKRDCRLWEDLAFEEKCRNEVFFGKKDVGSSFHWLVGYT